MNHPLTIRAALRTLGRLQIVARVPAEDLATALHPHLKAHHLVALALYLERVGERMWRDARQSTKNVPYAEAI